MKKNTRYKDEGDVESDYRGSDMEAASSVFSFQFLFGTFFSAAL